MDRDLQHHTAKAVSHFWITRKEQLNNQGKQSGRKDHGGRSAVTGGKQLDGFIKLIEHLVQSAGLPGECVYLQRRQTILPGFFRPTKEWDMVIVHEKQLMATIEFKSQVGPSFGNNFNNRTEEAIGSSHDFWTAYRDGAFQNSPRPWLGYLMLLENCPASSQPVRVKEPHFSVFDEFKNTSYAQRYEILCRRLIREKLYDAACLILSSRDQGEEGIYSITADDIGIERFAASLYSHIQGLVKFK